MDDGPVELHGDPADVAFFEEVLAAHRTKAFIRFMRILPADPRCRLCHAPFGGIAGRVLGRFGRGPSRKNPTMCNTCFEQAPMGGVEIETCVLFADVRGFTSMAETMAPEEVAELLNRFYAVASEVLTRRGIIDKMVGDEVMALYLPLFSGPRWADDVVADAQELLRGMGFGSASGPWLDVGIGIDFGRAFVGNVGSGAVKDFTALGDVVNTAARLQGAASAGQIVLSQRVFERLSAPPAAATQVTLELKGKQDAELAYALDLDRGT